MRREERPRSAAGQAQPQHRGRTRNPYPRAGSGRSSDLHREAEDCHPRGWTISSGDLNTIISLMTILCSND